MKKVIIILSVLILSVCMVTIGVLANRIISKENKDVLDSAKKARENHTVVAVVDGIEIYKEIIDFYATGEKAAIKNSGQYTPEQINDYVVDTEEILKKQIRNAVVLTEAKRQGLEVSRKEAEKYTLDNYEMVKEANDESYQLILDYMEEMNLNENEYLELCIESNTNKLTRAKLYEKFAENKTGTYEELSAQYEKYVEELVSKANIEYK